MKIKSLQSFIRGEFSKEGTETRIGDEFLTCVHNIDIDITGKLKRRRGYDYWKDLVSENSIASSINNLPDTLYKTGFKSKIQTILPYTDVAGKDFIFIVSSGYIYMQSISDNNKTWTLLNPNNPLNEKERHIDSVSYLDKVFFNDYQNNVYMYDSISYKDTGWLITLNKYIYFANDKILFRSYSNFSQDEHLHNIADVTQGSKIFHIAGNFTHHFAITDVITIADSTGNDGEYTVTAVDYDSGDDETDITVSEAISSEVVDGTISSPYRILIENNTNNFEGKAIYDSLVAIGYIGYGSSYPVNTASPDYEDTTDLALGYSLRIGNDAVGYNYFVLDCAQNDRSNNKCYLIKFNDQFIAQDYIAIDMDADGQIINFDYYKESEYEKAYIYIWAKDGEVHKLDEDFSDTRIDREDSTVHNIIGASVANKTFTVTGDYTLVMTSTKTVVVAGSTGNNGTYTVVSSELVSENTVITVDEAVSSAVVDGTLTLLGDNTDIASIVAPTNYLSKKQYSLSVNTTGLFLYSVKLPSRTDWYQPIIFNSTLTADCGGYSSTLTEYRNLKWQSWRKAGKWIYVYFSESYQKMPFAKSLLDPKSKYLNFHCFTLDEDFNIWDSPYSDATLVRTDRYYDIRQIGGFDTDLESSGKFEIWSFMTAIDAKGTSATNMYTYVANNRFTRWDTSPYKEESMHDINYFLMTAIYKRKKWILDPPDNTYTYDFRWVDNKPWGNTIGTAVITATYNNYFTYNKDRTVVTTPLYEISTVGTLSDGYQNHGNGQIDLNVTDGVYLLYNSTYHSTLMSSAQVSNYVLLLGFYKDAGDLIEHNFSDSFQGTSTKWRFIFPLGKTGDELSDICPLQSDDNEIYFGTSMVAGENGQDNGVYTQLNLVNWNLQYRNTKESYRRYKIKHSLYWFCVSAIDRFRPSISWEWSTNVAEFDGAGANEDYFLMTSYLSNINFCVYKTISNTVSSNIDRINKIGTPKTPTWSIEYDDDSELRAGTRFKYGMSYTFTAGGITLLSSETEEIVIPQLFSSKEFTTDYSGDNHNLAVSSHGYSADDVVRVSSTDTLPGGLSDSIDYYVSVNDVDNIELSTTAGGGNLVTLTSDGTGTHSIIRVNEPVKIKLTDLNLENSSGYDVYSTDNVSAINVYRREKLWNEDLWSDPILIGTDGVLTKDGSDDWYVGGAGHTYDLETTEDSTQSHTYNPFTEVNIRDYPVNHMAVHKSRLVLANRIDYDNPNVLEYSNTDVADAIPASNVRDIESGDGDYIVGIYSIRDFLYIFKRSKIYAILGDVFDGELLDISKNIGCKYKNLIKEYNNVLYFLNQDGIFIVSQNRVESLDLKRVDIYFDQNRNDCIDFNYVEKNAFIHIDKKNKEIEFHVPQKKDGFDQKENNFVIVYNIEYNLFKTRSYHDHVFNKNTVKDIRNEVFKQIASDYAGNVYEMSDAKHDNFKPIKYIMRTKQFTMGTEAFYKTFKIIKVIGRFMNNLRITYWIDGQRKGGTIGNRSSFSGTDSVLTKVQSKGRNIDIAIEISGEDLNKPPIEINEILVGYDVCGGF